VLLLAAMLVLSFRLKPVTVRSVLAHLGLRH